MSEQPAVPFLTEEAIHHAMESLRQARPLGDSPLRRLVWVWEQLNRRQPTFSSVEFDVTLGEALTSLIEERLAHHRTVEGIPAEPAANREATLDRLREDFTRDNAELEAWSILYHRYIRLELNLRVQDLAQALNATTRHVRRRLKHGYRRLAEAITRLESAARAANWHQWLTLKLPPASYAELFGRDEACAALLEDLCRPAPPHILVLTGPGGIGKTALAHAAARQAIDEAHFADFVWLTLEEPTAYPTLLADLAYNLGYPHLADADPAELETALRLHLRSDPTLVVVDNASYLSEYTVLPGGLDTLVAPGRLLLIARQRPTPDAPVRLVALGPLSRETFAALLHDEARRQRLPRTRLLDDEAVDAIYRTVGGNPLAGRLIASQLRMLPRERVLGNLASLEVTEEQRLFDVLFSATWQAIGRDAQLAALAMTLLPPEGVYWHDLFAILELPAEALDDALRGLVACSLIDARGEEPAYTIPALARRFVHEQAGHPPYAEHYRRMLHKAMPRHDAANDTPPPSPARAVSLLRRQAEIGERPEVLAELVVENAPAARRSGQWLVWRDVLLYIITHLQESGSHPRGLARALLELGVAYRWLGDTDSAESTLREAIMTFGEQGDFIGQAEALLEAGQLYEAVGQTAPAYEAYQRAAAAGHRYGELVVRRRALNGLVNLALNNNRVEEALALLDEALETFEDEPPDGQTLSALGMAHLRASDPAQALAFQKQALDRFREAGDLPNEARAHMRLGMAYNQAGQPDEAIEHLQQGFGLMRALGDVLGLARLMTNLGVVHAGGEQREAAIQVWREALALQEQLGDQVGMAYTHYNLADLEWKLGQPQAARDDLAQARALAGRLTLLSLLAYVDGHPLNDT